jgi:hypothetical protein
LQDRVFLSIELYYGTTPDPRRTIGLSFHSGRSKSRHLKPVQILLDLMKGIVANLVARPHGEHRLSRCLDG